MFKKRALLAILVSVIVVGTSTFGTLMYLDRRDYRNYLENQYKRNLYDVINDVDGLQVSLSKSMVTASPRQNLLLFGEIWKDASEAQDKLNALPISHAAISQTSKFLSQVGDFSRALLRASSQGRQLSDAEWNNVEKLRDYAGYLSIQLRELEASLTEGKIKWGEIKHRGRTIFQETAQSPVEMQFQTIANELQQYPTLIYDGPFAENVLTIKPKILSESEISLDKAKEIALDILGKDNVEKISIYSDKSGEKIPAYAFSTKIKGRKDKDVNIDISRNGGRVVYMLDPRDIGQIKLDMKEAIKRGADFLERYGYKNMIPTYALKYDNIAVVNYVYVQNNVVVYSDQIKLKIALDNGGIVGIESQHYLTAHTERSIPKPRISPAEARKNVSKRLDIKNARLALIPMESQREVFCYEFYGDSKGEKYLVYINALDGTEEKILKIVETPNGELTM